MRAKFDSESIFSVRGGRYFMLHDYWFFATREGASLGPYQTKESAIEGTAEYIKFIKTAPPSALKILQRENKMLA